VEKGCRIYVHGDAPVVINGSIQVNGEKDSVDRVYFQGDRLDEPYKDFPASWPGIFFNTGSKDNIFNYAGLKKRLPGNRSTGSIAQCKPKSYAQRVHHR
jgi:hypothetical protein